MKSFFALFCLGLAHQTFAFPQASSGTKFGAGVKVVGGEDAALGQFPHQVSLQTFWQHFCGGSLIAPDTVITAAHCIAGQIQFTTGVHAGMVKLSENEESSNIASWKAHEDYSSTQLVNDIAIIKLSSPFTLSENLNVVNLPPANYTPSLDPDECTVSGWGSTNPSGQGAPDALQFADIRGLSDAECNTLLGAEGFNGAAHFCAYENTTVSGGTHPNACFGDSGGPLICTANEDKQKYLFGVVSWGSSTCGIDNFPAVYTDVLTYLPWIERQMAILA